MKRSERCALVRGRLIWVLATAMVLLSSTHALAEAINVERRVLANSDEVDRAMRGFKFGGAAGVYFHGPEHHVGFSLAGDLLWNFRLKSLVLAPGARLSGYFQNGADGVGGFATLRAALITGPVSPFALGGAGVGFVSRPNEWGFAYQGGGGVLVAFRRRLSLGLEISYQAFANTAFHVANFASYLQISY